MAMQTRIILALASGILLALAVVSVYRVSANRRNLEQSLFHPDSISELTTHLRIFRNSHSSLGPLPPLHRSRGILRHAAQTRPSLTQARVHLILLQRHRSPLPHDHHANPIRDRHPHRSAHNTMREAMS